MADRSRTSQCLSAPGTLAVIQGCESLFWCTRLSVLGPKQVWCQGAIRSHTETRTTYKYRCDHIWTGQAFIVISLRLGIPMACRCSRSSVIALARREANRKRACES